MENQTQVEQPAEINPNAVEQIAENLSEENNVEKNVGSAFGKFKDATSLLSAYDSLQAEFTRKSQKLSETLKKLETYETGLSQEKNKGLNDGGSEILTENKLVSSLNKSEDDLSISKEKAELEKMQAKLDWKKRVDEFFLKNAHAKECSREIAKILKDEPKLRSLDNGIDIAYNIYMGKTLKKPADLIQDQSFIDNYVLTNSSIKSAIIKDYLEGTLNKNVAPKIINGSNGLVYAHPSGPKPKSISEAGKLAIKMLGKI